MPVFIWYMYIQLIGLKKCRILITVLTLRNRPSIILKEGEAYHGTVVYFVISERCYRTRRGRTDEQRYAIISPYFDGRIKMNGPYPEITNVTSPRFLCRSTATARLSMPLNDRGISDYVVTYIVNEWPISWNYEYIIFGQIIFQNFHQFKAFVGLSDYRTVRL
jgi:hypothetical protein